ncbi:hypothetical protein BJY52DRAFT_1227719 [Lactarius psammicola]|nr:hypothetical protein BJY52DRAFT_1227719 [Lactarius psammicola]
MSVSSSHMEQNARYNLAQKCFFQWYIIASLGVPACPIHLMHDGGAYAIVFSSPSQPAASFTFVTVLERQRPAIPTVISFMKYNCASPLREGAISRRCAFYTTRPYPGRHKQHPTLHTSTSSFIALHHSAILEASTPLVKYGVSLIPTPGLVLATSVSAPRTYSQLTMSPVYRINVSRSPHMLALSFGALFDITHGITSTSASSTTSSIPGISGAVSTYPHSLAATTSYIGTSALGGSHGGDLQIILAHTALYTPSPSSPIPVLGNAIPTSSQSSPTSSMSRSFLHGRGRLQQALLMLLTPPLCGIPWFLRSSSN